MAGCRAVLSVASLFAVCLLVASCGRSTQASVPAGGALTAGSQGQAQDQPAAGTQPGNAGAKTKPGSTDEKRLAQGDPQEEPPSASKPESLPSPPPDLAGASWSDVFDGPKLDEGKWVRWKVNDFNEEVADILEGRLRLATDTMGTDDNTVKFHGIRTKDPVVDLTTAGARVHVEVDWNAPPNGCYMTAGVYLCATVAEKNPRDEKDWLEVMYTGVPPGLNARGSVEVRVKGIERTIANEDWPKKREGRQIGRMKLDITLDKGNLLVVENTDNQMAEAKRVAFKPGKYYIYLQHSSHSNYFRREVFFDNVVVYPVEAGQ